MAPRWVQKEGDAHRWPWHLAALSSTSPLVSAVPMSVCDVDPVNSGARGKDSGDAKRPPAVEASAASASMRFAVVDGFDPLEAVVEGVDVPRHRRCLLSDDES